MNFSRNSFHGTNYLKNYNREGSKKSKKSYLTRDNYRSKQRRENTDYSAPWRVRCAPRISTSNRVYASWRLLSGLCPAIASRRALSVVRFSHTSFRDSSSVKEQCKFRSAKAVVHSWKASSYLVRRFVGHHCITARQIIFRTNGFGRCGGTLPIRESIRCIFIHRHVRFPIVLEKKLRRFGFTVDVSKSEEIQFCFDNITLTVNMHWLRIIRKKIILYIIIHLYVFFRVIPFSHLRE